MHALSKLSKLFYCGGLWSLCFLLFTLFCCF